MDRKNSLSYGQVPLSCYGAPVEVADILCGKQRAGYVHYLLLTEHAPSHSWHSWRLLLLVESLTAGCEDTGQPSLDVYYSPINKSDGDFLGPNIFDEGPLTEDEVCALPALLSLPLPARCSRA